MWTLLSLLSSGLLSRSLLSRDLLSRGSLSGGLLLLSLSRRALILVLLLLLLVLALLVLLGLDLPPLLLLSQLQLALLLLALVRAVLIGLRLLDSPHELVCLRPVCRWRRGARHDDLAVDDGPRRHVHVRRCSSEPSRLSRTGAICGATAVPCVRETPGSSMRTR